MQSKFKLISNEIEIGIAEMVQAYQNGNTIKIVTGDSHRHIKKFEAPELEQLMEAISGVLPFGQLKTDQEVVTMEELAKGKFFIIN